MFHDFDAPEPSPALQHSPLVADSELLSELGLSGRAIREILPDAPPAGARFEIAEFE